MKKFIAIFQNLMKKPFESQEVFFLSNLLFRGEVDEFKSMLGDDKKRLNKKTANRLFEDACYHNQLGIVKYLLTSPKTKIFHNSHLPKLAKSPVLQGGVE